MIIKIKKLVKKQINNVNTLKSLNGIVINSLHHEVRHFYQSKVTSVETDFPECLYSLFFIFHMQGRPRTVN